MKKKVVISIIGMLLVMKNVNAQTAKEKFFKENIPLAQYVKSVCEMPQIITLGILAKKTGFGARKYDILKLANKIKTDPYLLKLSFENRQREYLLHLVDTHLKENTDFSGEVIRLISEIKEGELQ